MIEITPMLDHAKKEPLYIQLYRYIKDEIQSGRIKPGIKLPSKRKLSSHLGISENTIETAYHQLSAEGYVETELRKGVFVKKLESDLYPYVNYNLSHNKHNVKKKGNLIKSILVMERWI
ncbi:winged helix-turn-helix domain-containing protein [Gracilibacillus sp. S3-1-1]|uniref:Winged helix-turn-helix domain-containing protein n=1 Tax=Gracilibacillus pellucidus TaxID=3095368 RepID=A0ACC6M5Q6_9BACI|nr:winged helix-turn-helix domain-containing protein [Gracilibacillus sp. S3-1-1]MDX8046253.1 winged helix-turn-helix domain-containing protein [Gracilibacillus sp. S3-1-1]